MYIVRLPSLHTVGTRRTRGKIGLCWNCVLCAGGGRLTEVLVDFLTEFEDTRDIFAGLLVSFDNFQFNLLYHLQRQDGRVFSCSNSFSRE